MSKHADHELEAVVLGACLVDDDAFPVVVGLLDAAAFDLPAHALVFEAMCAVDAGDLGLDVSAVALELKRRERLATIGGTARLSELMDGAVTSAHLEQHAKALAELARVRHAATLAREGAAATTTGQLASVAEQMLETIEGPESVGPRPLSDCIDRAFVRVEEAAKRGARLVGTSCGFREIDRYLGGYRPGQLILIAARPGEGKSALALAQARAMANEGLVLFFSLEMPEAELTDRLLCAEALVSNERYRNGQLTPEDLDALAVAAQRLDKIPLHIDDAGGLTLAQIAARARVAQRRAQAQGQRLVGVFIDYLGLVESEGYSESREREIGKISRGLKKLAKRLGVPIIALAQLNRGITKRGADSRPNPADLRDSGSLEQDADIIQMIWQEPVEDGEQRPEKNAGEILIAKHRGGRTGVVAVIYDGPTTSFFAVQREAA